MVWLRGLGLSCALMLTLVSAQAELVVSSFEYGVFSKKSNILEELITQQGVTSTRAPERITQTTWVPGEVGIKFGLRFTLQDTAQALVKGGEVRLKMLYLTPGYVDADSGRVLDKIEIVEDLEIGEAGGQIMAFQFSNEQELVPGAWHFYLFENDRKLLDKTFIVVK